MGNHVTVPLTAYVRPQTASALKRRARALGLSSSGYLKQLIERDLAAPDDSQMAQLTRQISFVAVGLDALLDVHPDATLRSRVHQVWQRKIQPQETSDDV